MKDNEKKYEGVVIEHEGTLLQIADENFVAKNGKTHFTWLQAKKLKFPKGWRLPTREEQCSMAKQFRFEDGKVFIEGIDGQRTEMPLSGYEWSGALEVVSTSGYYWSASPNSATSGYYLYFHGSGVTPSLNNQRSFGFPVRPVQELTSVAI